MILPAWFVKYQPRDGLDNTVEPLADEPDTMLALYVPAAMAAKLLWHGARVDASATIRGWLGDDGRLVTFGAYTAELEADVLLAGSVPPGTQ